jgi:4'-phosphopantetheinyl transferase
MIDVWRVALDDPAVLPPTPEEAARAARFVTEELSRRYLAAHAALRAVLSRYSGAPLEFATAEKGKPYLAGIPDLYFNLSHSNDRALIAVSRTSEVGVDIERVRAIPGLAEIAERYFPPGDEAPAGEVEFFRRWTQIEAVLKASGLGLYGAGAPLDERWWVREIDAGPGYAAAVAGDGPEVMIQIHDFGAEL